MLSPGPVYEITRLNGEMIWVREKLSILADKNPASQPVFSEFEIGPVNVYLFEKALRGRGNELPQTP